MTSVVTRDKNVALALMTPSRVFDRLPLLLAQRGPPSFTKSLARTVIYLIKENGYGELTYRAEMDVTMNRAISTFFLALSHELAELNRAQEYGRQIVITANHEDSLPDAARARIGQALLDVIRSDRRFAPWYAVAGNPLTALQCYRIASLCICAALVDHVRREIDESERVLPRFRWKRKNRSDEDD